MYDNADDLQNSVAITISGVDHVDFDIFENRDLENAAAGSK
jgi:hypothetical protein